MATKTATQVLNGVYTLAMCADASDARIAMDMILERLGSDPLDKFASVLRRYLALKKFVIKCEGEGAPVSDAAKLADMSDEELGRELVARANDWQQSVGSIVGEATPADTFLLPVVQMAGGGGYPATHGVLIDGKPYSVYMAENGRVWLGCDPLLRSVIEDATGAGHIYTAAIFNPETGAIMYATRTYAGYQGSGSAKPFPALPLPNNPTSPLRVGAPASAGAEASAKAAAIRAAGISPEQRTQNSTTLEAVKTINGEDAAAFLRANGVKEYARIDGQDYTPLYGGHLRGVFGYNAELYRVHYNAVYRIGVASDVAPAPYMTPAGPVTAETFAAAVEAATPADMEARAEFIVWAGAADASERAKEELRSAEAKHAAHKARVGAVRDPMALTAAGHALQLQEKEIRNLAARVRNAKSSVLEAMVLYFAALHRANLQGSGPYARMVKLLEAEGVLYPYLAHNSLVLEWKDAGLEYAFNAHANR